MPTARLPDVNIAFMQYRKSALAYAAASDYKAATGALHAFNALLPEEYRIAIDDYSYAEKTRTRTWFICGAPECSQRAPYEKIERFSRRLASADALTRNRTHVDVWRCPSCKKLFEIATTDIVQDELKEPIFLKVVPHPPSLDGTKSRLDHETEYTAWFWRYLRELECQAAQFRDDSWDRGGGEVISVEGGGEEQD